MTKRYNNSAELLKSETVLSEGTLVEVSEGCFRYQKDSAAEAGFMENNARPPQKLRVLPEKKGGKQ